MIMRPRSNDSNLCRVLLLFGIIFARHTGFQPLFQLAPGQQDTVTTPLALETDIGTQANDGPFIRTAGMRLSQTDEVVKLKIGKHLGLFSGTCPIACCDYTAGIKDKL